MSLRGDFIGMSSSRRDARAFEQRFQLEVDRGHAPARFGVERVAQVVRAVHGVVLADKHDGEDELVAPGSSA